MTEGERWHEEESVSCQTREAHFGKAIDTHHKHTAGKHSDPFLAAGFQLLLKGFSVLWEPFSENIIEAIGELRFVLQQFTL